MMLPSKTRYRKFFSQKVLKEHKDHHQKLKRPERRNLMSKLTRRFRMPLRNFAMTTSSSGSRA
jgi:hypothetical protein